MSGDNSILIKEKTDKVILYGLSIGGILAQSYIRRNKEKVINVIISHALAPKSTSYKWKIVFPLKVLNLFLPIIPLSFIRYVSLKLAGRVQGFSVDNHRQRIDSIDKRTNKLLEYFVEEFYEKYLTKRLLQTWIRLHLDYYYNEKFTPDDLSDWRGKILILRTDNDLLAQDNGEFKKLYPDAEVFTFRGTGHLTFYLQLKKIIEIINKFVRVHVTG